MVRRCGTRIRVLVVLVTNGSRAFVQRSASAAACLEVVDQAIGGMLATHAATALIAANRQLQFESALHSRDLLG